ncbi:DUF1800 domain-containing protein [Pseudoalteromonas luteoviolacea]|uniref:DUF1800 domain-containing protein n=1 Tax=Pseudoalteromonas luteoviolacea S4054 TaxID=1129367 RepID=A0A0F6AEH0_9GAMM|nr:DUF1800 domain-containing protein [Pseudoalteromonas luteoviolacea]AOT11233.1 hypothetical protein S4054249_20840 [Pseudoalteromonas luteoviolacea]AOT15602.1 hypothetical protein S40542_22750 [Pseudoalteromonas luteoviolacea]AOT21054.1 hypothetical protein S4054_25680 [Pseudoalteromonas luteoviolacea]KKE84590.1 hypothetical protein N479_08475 [Pseudoalteromonas luteoviolacea S4054]KZN71265.1 hypothetical protein N481_18945 [Pseudoalteromonas luteoviolacea S4047-1]
MKMRVLFLLVTLALSACGGGGSESSTPTATPQSPTSDESTNDTNTTSGSNPTASPSTEPNNGAVDQNASDDLADTQNVSTSPVVDIRLPSDVVRKGSVITIDSVIEGSTEGLSFAWTQISGPTLILTGADSASLTVTLPSASSINSESYTFSLTVTDSAGMSTYTETSIESVNAMTELQASALMQQATLGATYAETQSASGMSESEWLDQQIALAPTLHTPLLENYPDRDNPSHINRIDAWWKASLSAPDQLRQRVAFALSEIFVISDANTALRGEPEGMVAYYDMLLKHAFGNFRTLLESVTLSPAMGVYLSHLGNEKANVVLNIRPDENYAREVMQLFTIGLNELNLDGSLKLDTNGNTIPTYSQTEIAGFAKVFTGWTFAYSARWDRPSRNYTLPMHAFIDYHSMEEKTLLGGEVIPKNTGPHESMQLALDNLFSHSNVAPFISTQLIQRLVKSNPTQAYIARVATIFNDNGEGVKGDLGAVIKAILLDEEARKYSSVQLHSGKIKEPILVKLHLWRVLNARSELNRYYTWNLTTAYGQGPLLSPSVFNFFRPDHKPNELQSLGLVAPELQIATDSNMISTINGHYGDLVWRMAERKTTLNPNTIYMYAQADIEMLTNNGLQPLLDYYDLVYFAGTMSDTTRSALVDLDSYFVNRDAPLRVAQLLYMISLSPDFNYQN